MQEISQSTAYLLSNIYAGSGKCGSVKKHADDVPMRQTDESWWMTSQMSQQSHKSITQINDTRWDDVMTKNGKS